MNAATQQDIIRSLAAQVAAPLGTLYALNLVAEPPRQSVWEELDELETDWRKWFPAMNPDGFRHAFADFHAEAWDWYWPLIDRRLLGEAITDVPLTLLLIMGRGLAKSTTLENMAVCEGAQIEEAFILYVSSTQDKADEHVASVRDTIESSEVSRFYPGLSSPRIGKFGNQRGWRRSALYTRNGFAVVAAGLDKGVRGLKDGNRRPTMIIFDDIDERDDTPTIVNKKINSIRYDILPMGGEQTIVAVGQNLIHYGGLVAQAYRRDIDLFSYRHQVGPVNSFTDDLEIKKIGGRFTIARGAPRWTGFSEVRAQKLLDDIGPDAFWAECQNRVDLNADERVISNYEEKQHVISWSMFEKVFGVRRIPAHWEIHAGMDWGTTGPKSHPAVITLAAVSAQDSPLPGSVFIFWAHTSEAGETEHQISRRILEDAPLYMLHPGAREAADLLARSDIVRDRLRGGHDYDTEEELWRLRARAGKALPFKRLTGSHEAEGPRETFRKFWGINWQICDSGKLSGLSQLKAYLEPEAGLRHMFRPELMGRPSCYLVVADDQLTKGVDDKGLRLHRETFLYLKWDPNVAGREVPVKRGDDAYDSTKHLFQNLPFVAAPLTEEQRVEKDLDPRLQIDSPMATPDDPGWEMARAQGRAKVMTQMENAAKSPFESVWDDTV